MHPLKSFFSPTMKPFLESHSKLMGSPRLGFMISFRCSNSPVCPVDQEQKDPKQIVNSFHL